MTTIRATHRVTTDGHPPCYCLRESDAIEAAGERLPAVSAISVHYRSSTTGQETWDFLRAYP